MENRKSNTASPPSDSDILRYASGGELHRDFHASILDGANYLRDNYGEGRAPNGRPLSKAELKDLFARLDALGFVIRNDAKK